MFQQPTLVCGCTDETVGLAGQGGLSAHDRVTAQEAGKYGKGPYVSSLRMAGSIGALIASIPFEPILLSTEVPVLTMTLT